MFGRNMVRLGMRKPMPPMLMLVEVPLAATTVSLELVVPKISVRMPLPQCGD